MHAIHTVLFDADGVLQAATPGWEKSWTRWAQPGDEHEFMQAVFRAELPALAGEETIDSAIRRLVVERGLPDAAVEEILSAWTRIDVFPASFALVDEVRARGTRAHLATNQQQFRRDAMLGLGYEDHFDRLFFSCDLGVAKPDPRYFERLLACLGKGPEGILFVDDRADNVEAARSVGLQARIHATHDRPDQGIGDLRILLRDAGVPLDG